MKLSKFEIVVFVFAICLFSYFIIDYKYGDEIKLKINPDHNKYIIDPNLPMYKKYEWATWKDSAGGRMAHAPKWFILPNEKYIPKEVPFDWNKYKHSTALEKRSAYFTHLCDTEAVSYITSEFPKDIEKDNYTATSTWFYPRVFEFPIKNMKEIVNGNPKILQEIMGIADQNPYINPGFGYKGWTSDKTLGFDFRPSGKIKYSKPSVSTFREYMMEDGSIYRINFDSKTSSYLPLEKTNETKAQYYLIWKEIEKIEMKNLGIVGQEVIAVDRLSKKLIKYGKTFRIPLYMENMRGTNNITPISWSREINCAKELEDIKTVEKLE